MDMVPFYPAARSYRFHAKGTAAGAPIQYLLFVLRGAS